MDPYRTSGTEDDTSSHQQGHNTTNQLLYGLERRRITPAPESVANSQLGQGTFGPGMQLPHPPRVFPPQISHGNVSTHQDTPLSGPQYQGHYGPQGTRPGNFIPPLSQTIFGGNSLHYQESQTSSVPMPLMAGSQYLSPGPLPGPPWTGGITHSTTHNPGLVPPHTLHTSPIRSASTGHMQGAQHGGARPFNDIWNEIRQESQNEMIAQECAYQPTRPRSNSLSELWYYDPLSADLPLDPQGQGIDFALAPQLSPSPQALGQPFGSEIYPGIQSGVSMPRPTRASDAEGAVEGQDAPTHIAGRLSSMSVLTSERRQQRKLERLASTSSQDTAPAAGASTSADVETAPTEGRPAEFQCPDCSCAFARARDLTRHYRLHTGEKPYACPGCEERFFRVDARKRHLESHPACAQAHAANPNPEQQDDAI